MKSFAHKVAAITGASSGIGRALALNLAKQGCHLALSDVNEKGLAETVDQAKAFGVNVTSQKLDVANKEGVHAWADAVVREHGKVNLIFNNAGVALGSTVEGMSYDELAWVMNINFWGVVYGTKAFLPYLKASGDGHIINISSIFGICAQPTQSAYNASKFAVRGFTEALRQELDIENAPVSVTCVHPGGIKTNIAKAAKMNDSIKNIGLNPATSTQNFEKLFRTTPEEAANVILKAVQKDARRALIGSDAYVVDAMQRLLPTSYQKIVALGTKLMN
ncbi:MAG: SDR family oxidoreductase [Moraxellaceae bacterium]|nr:SDR family oxidoreductase [Pseudomonadales bacterium]MCP5175262.1 SDR family oxidoreductase [Moraxellaceae bacterium]MCP5177037.1 SDR family oxidoreductase [Moraxellaceae bacterium]